MSSAVMLMVAKKGQRVALTSIFGNQYHGTLYALSSSKVILRNITKISGDQKSNLEENHQLIIKVENIKEITPLFDQIQEFLEEKKIFLPSLSKNGDRRERLKLKATNSEFNMQNNTMSSFHENEDDNNLQQQKQLRNFRYVGINKTEMPPIVIQNRNSSKDGKLVESRWQAIHSHMKMKEKYTEPKMERRFNVNFFMQPTEPGLENYNFLIPSPKSKQRLNKSLIIKSRNFRSHTEMYS